VSEYSVGYLLAGLLPHGIIELPALFIGEAAALGFGSAAMSRRRCPRSPCRAASASSPTLARRMTPRTCCGRRRRRRPVLRRIPSRRSTPRCSPVATCSTWGRGSSRRSRSRSSISARATAPPPITQAA
ncbi:MAG: stage II sporulation protein M, partial [Thiohalocapsa sp.]